MTHPRGWLGILSIVALFLPGASLSHDIGVTQAQLTQDSVDAYSLTAEIGMRMTAMHPAPRLPKRCSFEGNPRGVQTSEGRVWRFVCDPELTSADIIELPWRRDAAMVTASWTDGSEARQLFSNELGYIAVGLAELQAGSGGWTTAMRRYTFLGIEHILLGIDHLLFVLGLLLIVAGPMMLVKTITAFTVAHSITLGLATFGLLTLPPKPVDAAIALSIVFLAMEVLRGWQGNESLTHRLPWLVAFGFGLLHGLGFAGALTSIGLPQAEIPLALLFFNVGVEIGQLAFVAVFLILRWSFERLEVRWSEPARLAPVYLIGCVSTYWLFERLGVMTGVLNA